jgi:hypothetical protein
MESLTPEQRRDRMMQMNTAEMARRNHDRVLNSTPEQRAQMNRLVGQRGPGQGGPGQGPPR